MTSFAQWQANRRNAAKSTGPITRKAKNFPLQRGTPRPHRRDCDRRTGRCRGLQGLRGRHHRRLRCAVRGRTRTRASAGQCAVAAAPRHGHGNRPVRDRGGPSDRCRDNAPAAAAGARRGLCLVQIRRSRQCWHVRHRSRRATPKPPAAEPQTRNPPPIPAITSRNAFYVWPICRLTRSTGSAATNTRCGARLPKSSSRSTISTVENRRRGSLMTSGGAGVCLITASMITDWAQCRRQTGFVSIYPKARVASARKLYQRSSAWTGDRTDLKPRNKGRF